MSKSSFLHLYAKVVAVATLLLIIAGGLVTSTGSGLSVPDWPLSYGRFFPPMIGGIRFEHTHRLIAAAVGLLTLALTIFFLFKEKRLWVKGLAVTALLAVVAQAVLGGMTVQYLLPTPVSVAHASLGQLFFCVVASLAFFTSKEWVSGPGGVWSPYARSFRHLAITTTVFILLQLVAGAYLRHSGGRGATIHFFLAFLIFVHIVFLNLKIFKDKKLSVLFLTQMAWLDFLFVCQIFLGLGSFFYKFMLAKTDQPRFWEVLLTTAHQTTGALILCGGLILCLRSMRCLTVKEGNTYPSDYLVLVKPRVTLAALATTLVGYLLGSASINISPGLLHTLLGSFFIGAGANALNQFFERDVDGKMERTENRPLPSGRMKAKSVFWFGLPLALAGFAELYLFVNHLTAFLGAATFLSYVFFYTPLKRRTNLNTFVGAIPGALPVVMGWTASRGAGWQGSEPLVLFLILFLWQIPHFFAIAWVHREDYRRSGFKMLPSEDPNGRQTALRIVLYSALLFPATLLPFTAGFSGVLYLTAALLTGIAFIFLAFGLFLRHLTGAKQFVSISIYYLFILMIFLVADRFL